MELSHPRMRSKIWIGVVAAMVCIAALFFLWWKGAFIPKWVEWKNKSFTYEGAQVQLQNRCLRLLVTDEKGEEVEVYRSQWDYSVQDVLVFDINHDGKEELILLVWKHGSYGKHLPMWVEHNDIRLEQHLFIFQWEEARENKLQSLWMSSTMNKTVLSIAQGEKESLIINNINGQSKLWRWETFGIKYVGESEGKKADFVCAGDNLIHLNLLERDYDSFYDEVRETVSEADMASLNQETIFVDDRGLISDYPRFGTPVEVGEAIVKAGFDLVTLANNHVLDKGERGIEVTTAFYDANQIEYVGVNPDEKQCETPADVVKFVTVNGIRTAVLNYTYGTNGLPSPENQPYLVERLSQTERVTEQIDYAISRADAVLVYVHWGEEYSETISDEQKEWTALFLEHGVDVVIGTHPHVIQPYEMLTDEAGHQMLVYYSLGNLISSQTREGCQVGGLAEFTLAKSPSGEVTIEEYSLQEISAN